MSELMNLQRNAAVSRYSRTSPHIGTLLDALREGMSIHASELTPGVVAGLEDQREKAEIANLPTTLEVVAVWLKGLIGAVANAPGGARAQESTWAIFETCSVLPRGVWSEETRHAWTRQLHDDGKFWPSPNALYRMLLPFADKIRGDLARCRALIERANVCEEPERVPPTPEEKERNAKEVAEMKAAAKRHSRSSQGERYNPAPDLTITQLLRSLPDTPCSDIRRKQIEAVMISSSSS